jgi:hypothetical protein
MGSSLEGPWGKTPRALLLPQFEVDGYPYRKRQARLVCNHIDGV